MSLYMDGVTECDVCHKQIYSKDDDWFCAPHFMKDMSHELWEYSGAFFHYECYKKWNQRGKFEKLFDEYKKQNPDFPIKSIVQTKKREKLSEEYINMILNELNS